MNKLILLFSSLIISFSIQAQSFKPSEVVNFKEVGDKDFLQLHFFLPPGFKKNDGQKRPAIVFFFGGGWSGGSPKQFFAFADHLAKQGMVAISAQYRTKKSHKVNPSSCVKDGNSAIRWVRENAAVYGIDPNKIAAGGGSAGGHVAAATATTTKFEEESEKLSISSQPNLLVLFNPVVDNSEKGYGYSRVKDYWQDFSPLHNIHKETPASIFFLGSNDSLIPVSVAKDWDAKIKAQGKDSEYHISEGQKHGFFNYKAKEKDGGKTYQEIITKMDAFLKKNGYLK
ncbi:alpha/beta hydrolase fold domain-containing protein [Lentisphaera profundi]|uniref:Alpha/beta hydrolase fold domain-containing protein n=1 Tax=Lentisphaera profundi TaxID=1658616 RepID=A0ABY7VTZ1_9BACT|nr:alpha/beta hydrolase fold domain-containing protein [Lentisphaera profundi]WDE96296.1 alpha/beta hydrolase fold domain-containing protein [Lentisphaera profundi]